MSEPDSEAHAKARKVLAVRDEHELEATSQGFDGNGEPDLSDVSPRYIRELARTYTREAIETLADIMSNPHASENARIRCADIMLNRAWGTPGSEADMLKIFLERHGEEQTLHFTMPMNADGIVLDGASVDDESGSA